MKLLSSIDQIKKANKKVGHHWFDDDAMRFFDTKVETGVFIIPEGSLFITSEKDPEGKAWFGNRRYTLRIADPNGIISTVGRFGEYFTLEEARLVIFDIVRNSWTNG